MEIKRLLGIKKFGQLLILASLPLAITISTPAVSQEVVRAEALPEQAEVIEIESVDELNKYKLTDEGVVKEKTPFYQSPLFLSGCVAIVVFNIFRKK